jgi:hypothetical protein
LQLTTDVATGKFESTHVAGLLLAIRAKLDRQELGCATIGASEHVAMASRLLDAGVALASMSCDTEGLRSFGVLFSNAVVKCPVEVADAAAGLLPSPFLAIGDDSVLRRNIDCIDTPLFQAHSGRLPARRTEWFLNESYATRAFHAAKRIEKVGIVGGLWSKEQSSNRGFISQEAAATLDPKWLAPLILDCLVADCWSPGGDCYSACILPVSSSLGQADML